MKLGWCYVLLIITRFDRQKISILIPFYVNLIHNINNSKLQNFAWLTVVQNVLNELFKDAELYNSPEQLPNF